MLVRKRGSTAALIALEVAQQTGSCGVGKVVLLMALFATAMVLLAVRIWRAAEFAAPVDDDHEPTLVTI